LLAVGEFMDVEFDAAVEFTQFDNTVLVGIGGLVIFG
jgi:hypothetical protein